jgi:diguanylate cyclase (GGDEF)-like protein
MNEPITAPGEQSPTLFAQRAITRWTEGWPPWRITALGALAAALVGLADYGIAGVAGYDFVLTALYLVPVGVAAFLAGGSRGLLVAVVAAAAEATATLLAGVGDPKGWAISLSVLLEFLVFVLAAYTVAGLRQHVEFEKSLSRRDALTGVASPRGLREAGERELERARRRPAALSLAYLDVDDFKAVNDSLGHAAGDAVLRVVGRTLREALRDIDTVARLGGDEFVALLPETDEPGCKAAVSRLYLELSRALAASGFRVTVSIGAATFLAPPRSVDELLREADRAMYAVKRGSKNGLHHVVLRPAPEPAARPEHARAPVLPAGLRVRSGTTNF